MMRLSIGPRLQLLPRAPERTEPVGNYVPSRPYLMAVRTVDGESATEWIGSLADVLKVAKARCLAGPLGGHVMVYRCREERAGDPLAAFRKSTARRATRYV